MKRIFVLASMLLAAGCVGLFDTPVVPMNMPVAQAVTQLDVTPHGMAQPIRSIRDKQQIQTAMRALEGERKDWYRPQSFPKEEFTLTFYSHGGRTRHLMLGDGWFGGYSGETRILRRLEKDEEEVIRGLLGIDPMPVQN